MQQCAEGCVQRHSSPTLPRQHWGICLLLTMYVACPSWPGITPHVQCAVLPAQEDAVGQLCSHHDAGDQQTRTQMETVEHSMSNMSTPDKQQPRPLCWRMGVSVQASWCTWSAQTSRPQDYAAMLVTTAGQGVPVPTCLCFFTQRTPCCSSDCHHPQKALTNPVLRATPVQTYWLCSGAASLAVTCCAWVKR